MPQKKLYALNPQTPPRPIQTQRTRRKRRLEPADPQSLERQVRQLLADKMTLALIAQALLHPLRQRWGTPFAQWDGQHFADNLCGGLEDAVQGIDDTIVVTYYNAPNVDHLRNHYEDLPAKLVAEGVNPKIPWLYNYQLDFRFR